VESLFHEAVVFIESNDELLEPQRHGWLHLREHFLDESKDHAMPALVQVPTGCGKTGLMAITPFGISRGRVLVVTPGLIINDGVLSNLDSSSPDNFWLKRNVIFSLHHLPSVSRYKSGLPLEAMDRSNIVIGNIQQMLRRNSGSLVNRGLPPDYFDMILVDEAHHAPAESWQEVFDTFPNAKKVLFTGTPFRGDGEPIHGELVYNYSLGEAMAAGLVKGMIRETHIPDKLTFTVDGYDGPLTLGEVRRIKDQDWISRNVAYSDECSERVIGRSIRLLNEKRSTGIEHKILASACSIAHAEQIRALYEAAGVKATIVHSDLSLDVREANIRDFELDRAQVMVHVSILGEGYDHPLISMVAMFKPYRSLNEYAQIAGRALRVIRDPKATDIDNTAHLVYHQELDLDKLWEYFRKERRKAEMIAELTGLVSDADDDVEHGDPRRRLVDTGTASEHGVGHSSRQSFLDGYDIIARYDRARAILEERLQAVSDSLRESGFQMTPEMEAILVNETRAEMLHEKRPDLELHELRTSLNSKIEAGVAETLAMYCIDPKGTSEFVGLREQLGYVSRAANDGLLVTKINAELKKFIGLSRAEWTRDDYFKAHDRVVELLQYVESLVRGTSDGSQGHARSVG
jgi:DNA repair protein RadD